MKCHYCKLTENLSRMGLTAGEKQRYICRECNKKRARKYRLTPNGKEATLRAIKKYEINHLERRRAWGKVQDLEMKPCAECNTMPVHKHHPDITRPLEIIYLCPLHHKQKHRQMLLTVV